MKPRWIFAVFGDMHVNSTVALCPPSVTLDDGGTYRASNPQLFIWRHWQSYWQRVGELRALYPGVEVWGVCLGELADNNYHKTSQLITINPADQATAALAVMAPAMEQLDQLVVLRGTEAHSGLAGAFDEMIAADLGAITHDGDLHSTQHWMADFDGFTIDAAHHPGTGAMRPWTRGGDANRLAAMVAYSYLDNDMRPPTIALRGHNHKPSDSADNHPTRAIINASWQLTNAYGHRLGSIAPLPVGATIVVVEDKHNYEVIKHYRRWPVRGEIFRWNSTRKN